MNQFFAKYCLYYPAQYLRGQKVWKYLHETTYLQTIPYGEILELRNQKIRNIINYSYNNIQYYRTIMQDKGISPEDIKGFDDLKCFPILTKSLIRDNKKTLLWKNKSKSIYDRKTGGSTGMVLHFTKETEALAKNDAIMFRCYKWYGIQIGDKQVRFWGVPVDPAIRFKERIKDAILNRIRISAFDLTSETCIRVYELIQKSQPTYFYGYTTAIYGFCHFLKNAGLDFKGLDLKAVICTAEKMYPHHRDLMSKMFDCPIVDEYGSSENGIIAFQCRFGNMHMMADHLAIEFVDNNNQLVKPGELGKVVITDLNGYAMPLIRYEIGDMARYSEQRCTCGITLPLMEIVEGRKEDFIRTKEGKLVHAAYLCYTLKDDAVHEFKMYQKDLNMFIVQIVRSNTFNSETEKKLINNLRSALGHEVSINFEYLERIPREKSGKLRYFVSEIEGSEL